MSVLTTKSESRWLVTLKAMGRSLVPILISLVTAYQEGGIHNWKDAIGPIIAGMLGKGVATAATARTTVVK